MNTIKIQFKNGNKILDYASKELKFFLEKIINTNVTINENSNAEWIIRLYADKTMEEFSFAVKQENSNDAKELHLTGYDDACVLHAAYMVLEKLGLCFEINGQIFPKHSNLDILLGYNVIVNPAIKNRGIRQHINFTMDISSYSLSEAKEYIRNMARMKMNYITFHSYNGQWHEFKNGENETLAGNFFYSWRHDIPNIDIFKDNIRNKSLYCIPEVEAVIENPQKRSEYAAWWLSELMRQAKTVGMKIRFSFEPIRNNEEACLTAIDFIFKNYSYVDKIEFITTESGGGQHNWTAEKYRELIVSLFGKDAIDNEIDEYLKDNLGQLVGTLEDLAWNIKLSQMYHAKYAPKNVPLLLGIYSTCPNTLNIAYKLMKKFSPKNVNYTLLPAHGARKTVETVQSMNLSDEDYKNTSIYSWVEFDGSMYLQQNPIIGLNQNIKEFGTKTADMCVNHWRNQENRTSLLYFSMAAITNITPDNFYKKYAEILSIEKSELYLKAMNILDETDTFIRDELFNIGFCAPNCWMNSNINWTKFFGWSIEKIEKAISEFSKSKNLLNEIYNDLNTLESRDYISFLINRIECSVLHLQSVICIMELHPYCKDERTAEEKAKIIEGCEKALSFSNEYINKHLEKMEDRGCEGTLISYFIVFSAYIDHIKLVYTDGEMECHHYSCGFDEPPAPAYFD